MEIIFNVLQKVQKYELNCHLPYSETKEIYFFYIKLTTIKSQKTKCARVKNCCLQANHINSAAIINSMKYQSYRNASNMTTVLMHGVRMLQEQRARTDRRPPCQQAIVLITDTLNENLTEVIRQLDPEGTVR